MKLPRGKEVYVGGTRYRGEIPDAVFDRLPDDVKKSLAPKAKPATGSSTKTSPGKKRQPDK